MITLYTTHCPKCDILKKKLDSKNIKYKEISDIDIMIAKGFMSVPLLEVDGVIMNFLNANEWADKQL